MLINKIYSTPQLLVKVDFFLNGDTFPGTFCKLSVLKVHIRISISFMITNILVFLCFGLFVDDYADVLPSVSPMVSKLFFSQQERIQDC